MRTVEEIMTLDVITVTPETEIGRAADLLLQNHVNGLPVVDRDGRLVGILCQSDLIVQQKAFPLPSVFTLLDGLLPLIDGGSLCHDDASGDQPLTASTGKPEFISGHLYLSFSCNNYLAALARSITLAYSAVYSGLVSSL